MSKEYQFTIEEFPDIHYPWDFTRKPQWVLFCGKISQLCSFHFSYIDYFGIKQGDYQSLYAIQRILRTWANDTDLKGRYYAYSNSIYFQLEDDAILFKLTWL